MPNGMGAVPQAQKNPRLDFSSPGANYVAVNYTPE